MRKNTKTQERLNVGASFAEIPLRCDTTVPLNSQKGITLIALVITIVVLLILAGVTLSIVFNGGIINKSQTAVEAYDEASARESLQIELVALMAEKVTNKDYDLDDKISNAGFTISGDMVIVNGYKFIIDRDKLQIVGSLGKGVENNNIGITLSQNISADYTKSIVSITVTSDKALEYIEVNGTKITDYTENNGTYTLNDIEVTENKTVSVLVQDIDKGYKINSIPVSELTEDMNIYTKADLIAFGQKVNEGRTFEGRTVTLMNDIDLNEGTTFIFDYDNVTFSYTGNEPENWIPIGQNYKYFSGEFDGGYHTISHLYANNNQYSKLGMFSEITNTAIIKNIIFDEVEIYNYYSNDGSFTGIIAINNGTIQNCFNKSGFINMRNGYSRTWNTIGGIVAKNVGILERCTNNCLIKANINSWDVYIGGLVGSNAGIILDSYNIGDIIKNESQYSMFAGGVAGYNYNSSANIRNTYNIGKVNGVAKTMSRIRRCNWFKWIFTIYYVW